MNRQMRVLCWLLAIVAGSSMSGCALCPPGYLDDYAAQGGKWQRSNPSHGRVGSILSDAGAVSSHGPSYYEGEVQGLQEGELYYEGSYEEIGPGNTGDVFPSEMGETQSVIESNSNSAGVITLENF